LLKQCLTPSFGAASETSTGFDQFVHERTHHEGRFACNDVFFESKSSPSSSAPIPIFEAHPKRVVLSAQKSQHLPFFLPVRGPLPFGPVPSLFGIFSPNTDKKKG
jgi:hypothetical protein